MSTERVAYCAGAVVVFFVLVSAGRLHAQPEIVLAAKGQARFRVVVSDDASTEVRAKALTLATHLGLISGADFAVASGSGEEGLAVGVYSDFPALSSSLAGLFGPDDVFRQDEYLLRSHAKGLFVLGATEIAVSHAVWDCLYRLGYRRFFPPRKWEIIPKRATLTIAVDASVAPDFVVHRYSGIGWDIAATVPPFREWAERNRMTSGFDLENHHVYQAIISKFRNEFRAHPEYYGLLNGQRTSHKICVSNPSVQNLAIGFAIDYLAEHPGVECVSMEPSDGAKWCECVDCAALGSISDRALTLANVVAKALQKTTPGCYVGMLAYHMHAPPPTIDVERNVIEHILTRFPWAALPGYPHRVTARELSDHIIEGNNRRMFLPHQHPKPIRRLHFRHAHPEHHRDGQQDAQRQPGST